MNKTDNTDGWEQNLIESEDAQVKEQISDSERSFDDILRAASPLNLCTAPPANLHAGIMQAVHKSAVPRRTVIFPLITSIAASLLIICYITINNHNRTQRQAVTQITKSISQLDSQVNSAVVKAPGMLDAPMQQELDAFKDDIQNATAYLLACIE
jgi:uncharacterized protein (DUF1800 family)